MLREARNILIVMGLSLAFVLLMAGCGVQTVKVIHEGGQTHKVIHDDQNINLHKGWRKNRR